MVRIEVATKSGPQSVEVGFASGQWAFHKRLARSRGWTVTHIPTGRVASFCRTRKSAERVLGELERHGATIASLTDVEGMRVCAAIIRLAGGKLP